MTIKEELLEIKGDNDLLYPGDVVDWASKHPQSDLHSRFEWNNEKAGAAYRLWQARELITIHIRTEQGEPEMVSLSIDRKQDGGYRSIKDVVDNVELRDVMLSDAMKELSRVRSKYGTLRKLAGVWREIQKAEMRFETAKAKAA